MKSAHGQFSMLDRKLPTTSLVPPFSKADGQLMKNGRHLAKDLKTNTRMIRSFVIWLIRPQKLQ